MKRYRYIGCGATRLEDSISDHRLLSNRNYMGSSCIRVEIPNT